MPLPTLVKSWQFQVNQTVPSQGSGLATERRVIRIVKDVLKAFASNPWSVRGSSNGVAAAMDSTDRWASDADIVKAASGTAHSWIVLRQTGIATNFELCIDMNSASQTAASFVVSPSVGFSGGSTTARPTAADEIVLINASAWIDANDVQHQIHAMQSTDGQCTRLQIWRGGTNQCTFMLFDRPQNPPAGWTNPSVSFVIPATSGYAGAYTNLISVVNGRGRGSATFNIFMTGENNTNAQGSFNLCASDPTQGMGSVPNDFDGQWPFYPVGIGSVSANHRGRHGTLFDLWWRPIAVNDADSFPNNAATRQFMALGNLIFPWVGDATTALLT